MSAEEGFPLSPAQERAWVQASRRRALRLTIDVEGPLERRALARAVGDVGERWEILRTTFRSVPGLSLPLQVIGATPPPLKSPPPGDVDLPADFRPASADVFWVEDGGIEEGGGSRLVLSADPLVADRETLVLWAVELGRHVSGRDAEPEEEPVQYVDILGALAEMDEAGELAEDRRFWQKRGAPQPVSATLLRAAGRDSEPGPERESGAGRWRRLRRPLSAELVRRAREHGLDLAASARTALRYLWTLLAGCPFAPLGIASSSRELMGLEGMLGPMTQWLPDTSALAPDATWRTLVEESADEFEAMAEHQAVPATTAETRIPLGFVDNRLDSSVREIAVGDAIWRLGAPVGRADATPIVALLEDREHGHGDGFGLALEYDDAVLSQESAGDLLDRWQGVLRAALAGPDGRSPSPGDAFLDAEPVLLSAPDAGESTAGEALTREPTLPQELFARAAARPDAVAVRFLDSTWTCGRLAAEVESLARRLLAQGVDSGERVALYFEHGLETLVAPLAVWSTGAAYVPLDCDAPAERLRFVLEDASVGLVLHHPDHPLPANLSRDFRCHAFGCTEDGPEMPSPEFVPARPAGADLAYLMYTSGSTGRPNGVRIHHGALQTYLRWAARDLLAPVRVLPAITRLTFDACLKQLFAPILAEKEVWILPRRVIETPAELVRALRGRQRVGLNAVPSLWTALLDAIEDDEGAPPDLAAIYVGGEALPLSSLQRTAELLPQTEVWNLYGLTETTANDVVGRLRPEHPIVLGRPVAGAEVAVLDRADRSLPPWVEGEIHVAGPRLSLGYENRDELNRERFVELDLDGRPRRFLRTGDRGYRRPDGTLSFLGRRDDQVKIRGFRIERGEVESTLTGLEGVVEGAVDLVRDGAGGHLVAYAAVAPPLTSEDDVTRELAERLPAYAVPGRVVLVQRLPRLPNGKLDRQALAASRVGDPEEDSTLAPEHDAVADLWQELLGTRPRHPDDDFFRLGGHSLLVARMTRRLRDALGVDIPLVDLINHSTVAGMTGLVRRAEAGELQAGDRSLITLRSGSADGPSWVFFHTSSGNAGPFRSVVAHLDPDSPVYAFQASGLSPGGQVSDSVEAIAASYLDQLQEVPRPWHLVGWSFGGMLAYEVARRSPESVARLLFLDAASPSLLAKRRGPGESDADHLAELFGRDFCVDAGDLRHLGDRREMLETLRLAGIGAGRLSPLSSTRELERYLEVFKSHLAAGQDYAADREPALGREPFDVPVTMIRAADEPMWGDAPDDLGWSSWLGRRPTILWHPGEHLGFFEPEQVSGLGELLKTLSARASKVSG